MRLLRAAPVILAFGVSACSGADEQTAETPSPALTSTATATSNRTPGISDLGLPYQTVPATFWRQLPATPVVPASVRDCGYAINAPGIFPSLDATGCLGEALAACTPAMLQYTMYTTEGDPIAWVLQVVAKDGGCRLAVKVDSRDNFGEKGVWEGYCEEVERQQTQPGRDALLVTACTDEHLGVLLPR